MSIYNSLLSNPHGSDVTLQGSQKTFQERELSNPHGSDVTILYHSIHSFRKILSNPHGSDVTNFLGGMI